MKLLLILAVLLCNCYSQTQKEFCKDTVTLCWGHVGGVKLDGSKYIIYYREHNTEKWEKLAETDELSCVVRRPEYGYVDFGVQTIYGTYTSEIMSSLDSSSCLDTLCGDSCTEIGPWYVDFMDCRPQLIRLKGF
jgi:hypothetical protein